MRAIFLIATAVSVPMGAAVSTAYTSGGGTFASGASLIVALGIGLQIWGLGSTESAREEFRSVLRYGAPNMLAMILLLTGGWLGGDARKVLWAMFVLVVVAGIAGARFEDWLVRPGHFAERHGLIVIIALGEIVVAAVLVIAVVAYVGRDWDGVTLLLVVDGLLLVSLFGEHVRIETPSSDSENDLEPATAG